MILISTIVIGLNYIYRGKLVNYGTMGMCKNDSAYIADVPYDVEVANFGNSHGYYGFNYEKLGYKFRCFNFSLPSQTMSYNYQIMDNYKKHFKPGGVIFLCISYQTFFGDSEVNSPDFLSKNRRYYHFLDENHIKCYDKKSAFYVKYLPIAIDNPGSVVKHLLGKGGSSGDMWNVRTNNDDAKKHGDQRTKGWIGIDCRPQHINVEEIEAVYKIIYLCKQLRITPVMITTPYLVEYTKPIMTNNKEFFDIFYAIVNKMSKDTGVRYIDYAFDDRFKNDYSSFFNTDHMNRVGAYRFTNILANDVGLHR